MDSVMLKAAAAAIAATTGFSPQRKPATIARLLRAKLESDRKHYEAKHSIMRELIQEKPHEFRQDSEEKGILGVTHHPSGFRMHLPKTVMPLALKKLVEGTT
jgi:hypothetical protein